MSIERTPIRNRGDWLAMRRRDLGASEVAALFGLHKNKTVLQLFAEKTGASPGQGDNSAMRRGRILEPGCIVALAEEKPDWRFQKAGFHLRDGEIRIGATPDYLRIDEGKEEPIECKSVAPEIFDRDWKDGPPMAATLQTLVQMKLLGAERGYVACLIDNRAKDFFLFDVPNHDAAWQRIVEAVATFWKAVDAGDLPKVDYARDGEALRSLYPRDNGACIDLTSDNRLPELLAERASLKSQFDGCKSRIEEIECEVKAKLGEHSAATLNGWRISHKEQSRKAYTVKETTFRVLRITQLKEAMEAAQ